MEHPTTEPSSPEAVPKTTDVSAETEPQTATLDNQNQTQWPGFGDDGVVEIDDQQSDTDSALGNNVGTGTTSLASSVEDYLFENGRRYHAYRDGEYVLPNDEREQARMDLKHHIFGLLLGGKSFLAPIGAHPQRILDVGTGTGIWAIDVADDYPTAQVVGIDLSPIQPSWVPPNLKFVVDDAEAPWPYPEREAFDFVHWRMLLTAIKDWPHLYEQAYTHLKPGGWLEVQEHASAVGSDDESITKAKDLVDWFKLVHEACDKFGKAANIAHMQKQWMIDAGFVDVQEDVYKVPLGRWPKDKKLKEIGLYFQAQTLDGLEPVSMALFTRILGYSKDEVEILLTGPRRVLKDPECHLFIKFYIVRGRKPSPDEVS